MTNEDFKAGAFTESGTPLATSSDIGHAARALGFNGTQSAVLGVLLYWEQMPGGIVRAGKRWRYRTAAEIAAATSIPIRTVQRALRDLYDGGVLEHLVIRDPRNPMERVTGFRMLDRACQVLRRAQQIAEPRAKRRGGGRVGNATLASSFKASDCHVQSICQSGGLNEQQDTQKNGQLDFSQSPAETGETSESQIKESQEEEEKWKEIEAVACEEKKNALQLGETLNDALAERDLPPLKITSDEDCSFVLEISTKVEAAGWAFRPFVGAMLDGWQQVLPNLPTNIATFDGNQARPSVRALGWAAKQIVKETGFVVAASRLRDRIDAMDPHYPGLLKDAAKGLATAAHAFLIETSSLSNLGARRSLPKGLTAALQNYSETADFAFSAATASEIATASARPEFTQWLGEKGFNHLPRYRDREKAVAKSLLAKQAADACVAGGGDATELKAAAKAAFAVVAKTPSEETCLDRCRTYWTAYIEATSWAGASKGEPRRPLPPSPTSASVVSPNDWSAFNSE